MKKALKIIGTVLLLLAGLYVGLFLVFFLDLDGKLLFRVVEPALKNHYDNMKRPDPLQKIYPIQKPNYEYDSVDE